MSILIYAVPRGWEPPVTEVDGAMWELPMLRCSESQYSVDLRRWKACVSRMGEKAAKDYMGEVPNQNQYWPEWPREERTHFIAYCTTTGTSVSAVCENMEALAHSLVDAGQRINAGVASTFADWINALRECSFFKETPSPGTSPTFKADTWRYT